MVWICIVSLLYLLPLEKYVHKPISFITFAAFQLIFGKLFSFYSIKYVFLASVVIFEVGSLICATALTSRIFIIGRAFAGLGSAGINAGFIM